MDLQGHQKSLRRKAHKVSIIRHGPWGHIQPRAHHVPFFFPKGLRVTAEIYQDVLRNVVKPWMDKLFDRRTYVFQHDSASATKAKMTQS